MLLESSPYNKQISVEPRLGLRWQVAPGNSFIAGFGLHSRTESLAVYNSLIKRCSDGIGAALNRKWIFQKLFTGLPGLISQLSK